MLLRVAGELLALLRHLHLVRDVGEEVEVVTGLQKAHIKGGHELGGQVIADAANHVLVLLPAAVLHLDLVLPDQGSGDAVPDAVWVAARLHQVELVLDEASERGEGAHRGGGLLLEGGLVLAVPGRRLLLGGGGVGLQHLLALVDDGLRDDALRDGLKVLLNGHLAQIADQPLQGSQGRVAEALRLLALGGLTNRAEEVPEEERDKVLFAALPFCRRDDDSQLLYGGSLALGKVVL